jgi:hypothetical protein
VHFAREGNPPGDFFPYLITTFSWHRFSAISLWILVLFLIYVTITACASRRRRLISSQARASEPRLEIASSWSLSSGGA